MDWPVLHKAAGGGRPPNLAHYGDACARFSWEQARSELAGLPEGRGINIAHEAVDRHLPNLSDKPALVWIGKDWSRRAISYGELAAWSNRFANALVGLGLQRGDRVFLLLPRIPELYVAALGTWKAGMVLCPLFPAFGPEPIKARMTIAEGAAIVTTPLLFRRKVAAVLADMPFVRQVIFAGADDSGDGHDFATLLERSSEVFKIAPTQPDELATLHFTSGTTGRPKGAMHVHEAVIAHRATARLALDLGPEDVFWCTADPGWVTGTSYGIIGPLTLGATMIADEEDFDAERWYRILSDNHVTVWYTAPTAVRMLMKAGGELPVRYDLSRLRLIASVGEPLNPEAVMWGNDVLGRPIHDNWWQSETGGIMVSNFLALDIKPGSMGRPMPGVRAGILRRTEDGVQEVLDPDVEGELALRPGWPSMFRGYLKEEERFAKCFAGGWYLTGDLVRRDSDGYYWFVGRADDVIKSAGHLIGPFEVESALMEHPAVAEAAVIGVPDPIALEVVKAFVSLHQGRSWDEALKKELLAHARKRLGPAVAPRDIEWRQDLPKTRSGKIMRRLLKARELGLPEGDLSTLESPR
jgi:acetyl-CoA synthetase